MKRFFMFCIASLLLLSISVSCTKGENENENKGGDFMFSETCITRFYKMDFGDLFPFTCDVDKDVDKSVYTFIWQGSYLDYCTKEVNPEKFKQLCDNYGDFGLKAYWEIENQGSINNFSGITVTSDSDFPNHPAGSDLGDVVYVRLTSCKPFIDSGYSKSFLNPDPIMINGFRLISSEEGHTCLYKLAKDITPEDLMLIERNFYVEFHEKPIDHNKIVYITVSLKQEGEDPIACTIGVNFGKF